MQLEVFLDYTAPDNDLDSIYSFSSHLGARIFVENQSVSPFLVGGVQAPVGKQTNFRIKKNLTNKLGKPYSSCIENELIRNYESSTIVQTFYENNQTYSQKMCFFYCYQKYLVERCKCHLSIFPLNQLVIQ